MKEVDLSEEQIKRISEKVAAEWGKMFEENPLSFETWLWCNIGSGMNFDMACILRKRVPSLASYKEYEIVRFFKERCVDSVLGIEDYQVFCNCFKDR